MIWVLSERRVNLVSHRLLLNPKVNHHRFPSIHHKFLGPLAARCCPLNDSSVVFNNSKNYRLYNGCLWHLFLIDNSNNYRLYVYVYGCLWYYKYLYNYAHRATINQQTSPQCATETTSWGSNFVVAGVEVQKSVFVVYFQARRFKRLVAWGFQWWESSPSIRSIMKLFIWLGVFLVT